MICFCQDMKLINATLTAKSVIDVLSHDDPNVADEEGAINLELEMTFLEFLEALVGCAEVYVTEAVVKDPNTPRPSTAYTPQDGQQQQQQQQQAQPPMQSSMSSSHETSQVRIEVCKKHNVLSHVG